MLDHIGTTVGQPPFWVGLIIVVVFSFNRFNVTFMDVEELDPPVNVRSFTTRFRYYFAALCYAAVFSLLYLLLIFVEAIPSFREFVEAFLGLLGMRQPYFGSPAWAALATTSILPAVPGLRALDDRLRDLLQEFASIPTKARQLAREITMGLDAARRARGGPQEDGASGTLAALLWQIDLLRQVPERLKRCRRFRASSRYARFFHENGHIQEHIADQVGILRQGAGATGEVSELCRERLASLSTRLTRYIVCATLHVESDEFMARRMLAQEVPEAGIRQFGFRFTGSQALLILVAVLIVTTVGALVSTLVTIAVFRLGNGLGEWPISLAFMAPFMRFAFLGGLLAVPVFLPALFFAAGCRMYMADKATIAGRPTWDETVLAVVLTFFGALVFALVPAVLIGLLLAAVSGGGESASVYQFIPWALPPAIVAVTFFARSGGGAADHPQRTAVVDFLEHALLAAAAGWLAAKLSILAGLPFQVIGLPEEFVIAIGTATIGLLGGAVGALQCAMSRQRVADRRRLPQAQEPVEAAAA
jgi:hypothetical protein